MHAPHVRDRGEIGWVEGGEARGEARAADVVEGQPSVSNHLVSVCIDVARACADWVVSWEGASWEGVMGGAAAVGCAGGVAERETKAVLSEC